MGNTLFHIIDLIILLGVAVSGIYIFIFSMASLSGSKLCFPSTAKRYRFAIFLPDGSSIGEIEYPIDLYSIFHYQNDLVELVHSLDEDRYDVVIILGEITNVSKHFLRRICDAYYC